MGTEGQQRDRGSGGGAAIGQQRNGGTEGQQRVNNFNCLLSEFHTTSLLIVFGIFLKHWRPKLLISLQDFPMNSHDISFNRLLNCCIALLRINNLLNVGQKTPHILKLMNSGCNSSRGKIETGTFVYDCTTGRVQIYSGNKKTN